MGGNTNKIRNSVLVFLFVALWHDIKWHLILWAIAIIIALIPEILITVYKDKINKRFEHKPWFM